jgi:hypothetical protein
MSDNGYGSTGIAILQRWYTIGGIDGYRWVCFGGITLAGCSGRVRGRGKQDGIS